MKSMLIACLVSGALAGTAFAKLPPPPPMTDAQKAEKAAKDKSAAEKDAAMLAKAQDKAVANHKKTAGADPKAAPAPKKK